MALFFALAHVLGAQGGTYAAQRLGVVPQVRTHRRGQRQVLGGCAMVPSPGQRQPEPELRVVVGRAGLDYPPETADGSFIMPGVELGPAQRLQNAARLGFSGGRALEPLSRRRRTAPAEQVKPSSV